jgi:uncharacterized protein YxeA
MKQILIIIMVVVVGIIIASPFIQKEIILANSEKHADSLIAHCDSVITDTYSIIGYTPTKDLSTSEVESLFSGTK